MFIERMSDKEINQYCQKVFCGEKLSLVFVSDKNLDYTENGYAKCLEVDFCAIDNKTDKSVKIKESVWDFQLNNDKHTEFMIDKYGLDYILKYKSFVKASNLLPSTKDYYIKCATNYYLNKEASNKQQVTLDKFFMQQ